MEEMAEWDVMFKSWLDAARSAEFLLKTKGEDGAATRFL